MKIRYFAAATLATCALTLHAMAAEVETAPKPEPAGAKTPATVPAPGKMMARLRAADTNQDRQVSPEEFAVQFPNAPAEQFARLDRNGDGHIDRQDRETASTPDVRPERTAKNGPPQDATTYLKKLVKQHDADGDGRVTQAEVEAAKHGFPPLVFGALDRDGDGALTAADAAAPAAEGPANGKPQGEKKTAKQNAATPGETPKKTAKPEKKRPELDLNKDGTITFEEAVQVNPGLTRERFDKRDKNGDGVLTKADRASA